MMPLPAQIIARRETGRLTPLMAQRPRPRYSNLPMGPLKSTAWPTGNASMALVMRPPLASGVSKYTFTSTSKKPSLEVSEMGV